MNEDGFDLDRFVTAQASIFDIAMEELRTGRKRSHWMWFVFPQLRGLGQSSTARFYGIASLEEARAYLDHPVLGLRLAEATRIVMDGPASSLRALFGTPDDLKFRSCMTLFAVIAPDDGFASAIDRCCAGERDARTLALLNRTC